MIRKLNACFTSLLPNLLLLGSMLAGSQCGSQKEKTALKMLAPIAPMPAATPLARSQEPIAVTNPNSIAAPPEGIAPFINSNATAVVPPQPESPHIAQQASQTIQRQELSFTNEVSLTMKEASSPTNMAPDEGEYKLPADSKLSRTTREKRSSSVTILIQATKLFRKTQRYYTPILHLTIQNNRLDQKTLLQNVVGRYTLTSLDNQKKWEVEGMIPLPEHLEVGAQAALDIALSEKVQLEKAWVGYLGKKVLITLILGNKEGEQKQINSLMKEQELSFN